MTHLCMFRHDSSASHILQGGCIQPNKSYLDRSRDVIIGVTVVWVSIFLIWMPLGLLYARLRSLPRWRVQRFRTTCLSRVVGILTLTCACGASDARKRPQ
jgi:hypothetical protein